MEGYLRKQDHTALVKGWKKRYFRLAATPPATLYYYKEANSKEPIDGVPLANTKTYEHSLGDRKTEGLVFIVETKDRQYILAADSKPELQQWMAAIQRAAAPPAAAPVAVKQAIPVKQAVRPPSARGATPSAPAPGPAKDEFADDMAKMMADLMQEEKARNGPAAPAVTPAAPAYAAAPAVSVSAPSNPAPVPDANARRANRAASRMGTDLSKALADPAALAQLEAEAAAAAAANPVVPSASPRRGATLMGSRGLAKPPAAPAPPPPTDALPPPSFAPPPVAPAPVPVPAPAPAVSPRKPSSDALIGERIGVRTPAAPAVAPAPAADALKTSQAIRAPAVEPAPRALEARKPSVEAAPVPAPAPVPTPASAAAAAAVPPPQAQRAALKMSAARLGDGDEGTAMIGGRRRTAVAPPPMEPAPAAPAPAVAAPTPTPVPVATAAAAAPKALEARKPSMDQSLPPPLKKDTISAGSAAAASASAAPSGTSASTAPAPATASATAGTEEKKRGPRATFLAGNRRATVVDKATLAAMAEEANAAAARAAPSGSMVARDWNSGMKRTATEAAPAVEHENISPNLPMPARRVARLQLGAQREEEDFFHLHKDDQGYYLLETPWQFRCFLRRLDEGAEGAQDDVVRVSLQGLLLERVERLWMLNPAGYHTVGPRSTEPFVGDLAECLFELEGGITVRYNRAKWELLDAYVAEASAATVVQQQQLPTIAYKIRNYKQYPAEVKGHLSELDDAVDLVNQHFEQATDPDQWHALGDEALTPAIGDLVRRRLAGALTYALSYGFNASKGFFGGAHHLWHFFEAYLERTSFRQLLALGLVRAVRAVNAAFPAEDCDGKVRAFLCAALNSGLLHEYLQLLAGNDEAVERFFQPQSLIRVPALLAELVESTEPLSVFSFRLNSGLTSADEASGAAPQVEPLTPVEQLWSQIGADVETSAQSAPANVHEEVTPYDPADKPADPAAAAPASSGSDRTATAGSGRAGSPSRMAATSPQRARPGATSPQRLSDRAGNAPPSSASPQRERPGAAGTSPQKERPTPQLRERPATSPLRERPLSIRDEPAPAPAAPEEGLLSTLGKSLSSWWG